MSIWYDGSNLNMYRGDYGKVTFQGLPYDKVYVAYFGVKSISSNETIFEIGADVITYWCDSTGVEIPKSSGETEEEYQARCEALSRLYPPQAFKSGKCTIDIKPEISKKLTLLKTEKERKYYFGLKVCCAEDGDEDTLIPAVKYDETTGKPIFSDPPYLIVRHEYVDGLKSFEQFCDVDPEEYGKDPRTYGLQPFFGDVRITDLRDGDVLVYDFENACWRNKHSVDGGNI